jgi:hypothetical protein
MILQDYYELILQGDSGGPVTFLGAVVAINAGISPPTNQEFNSEKVNIHIGIDLYRNFIHTVLMYS